MCGIKMQRHCVRILKIYLRFVSKIMELLSEGLGLNPNHLKDYDCNQSLLVMGHYYPACPEPECAIDQWQLSLQHLL